MAGKALAVVVVVDEVHLLQDREGLEAVAVLVDHLAPGSQLVVLGRELPPLPVAGWRAGGRLAELGPGELAMSPVEAGSLVRAAGVELADAQVAELVGRTEGWPVALGEVEELLGRRPDLGTLPEQASQLRSQLDQAGGEVVGAAPLTAAELRLCPSTRSSPRRCRSTASSASPPAASQSSGYKTPACSAGRGPHRAGQDAAAPTLTRELGDLRLARRSAVPAGWPWGAEAMLIAKWPGWTRRRTDACWTP